MQKRRKYSWEYKQSAGNVILHSDRGSQYTSQEYQLFLTAHGIVSSMSAQPLNRKHYLTRAEARSDIFDYIERFYNQRKLRQLNSDNIHQPALNGVSVETG